MERSQELGRWFREDEAFRSNILLSLGMSKAEAADPAGPLADLMEDLARGELSGLAGRLAEYRASRRG